MRCQKVRSFLSAYCKNELRERRQDAIRVHLESCSECRREEALCREIEGSYGKLSQYSVSGDFNTKLLNRIAAERFKETRSKAYFPKNVPVFGWGKIVPAVATACLVLAFVFSGGLDILNKHGESGIMADRNVQNIELNDDYAHVQPISNPAFANVDQGHQAAGYAEESDYIPVSYVSSNWTFKKELERATRIRNLMNSLARQNGFAASRTNLASILTNPEGQSIVMRRPFGRQAFNGLNSTNAVQAVGR